MKSGDTLLIVGNGLDLTFGLHTSYVNFMEDDEVKKQLKGKKLFGYLEKVKEAQNWVDIEKELYNYCQLMYGDPDCTNYDSHGELREEYNKLCTCLKEYLRRVMHKEFSAAKDNTAILLIKDLCEAQESPLEVITFNYTNTLERISNITTSKMTVHHVHGSLEEGNGIVFGIEDSVEHLEPNEVYLYKSYSKFKDLTPLRRLLPFYKRIVFYGYSLGDTDKQYFERFFKKLSDDADNERNITIYHHGTSAYDDVNWQLQSYTDHNLTGLNMNHYLEFIDTMEPYQSPSFLK